MAKRHGAVLVFKEGTTPQQAAKALGAIRDFLDVPEQSFDTVPTGEFVDIPGRDGTAIKKELHKSVMRPFKFADMVREFDDKWGGPVWYIP